MKINMFRLKNGDVINQIKEIFKITPNIKHKENFKEIIIFFFKRKIIEKQNQLETFEFISYVNSNFEIENENIISISNEEMNLYKDEIIFSFNPNMYNEFNGLSEVKKTTYAKVFFGLELFNHLKLYLKNFTMKELYFLCGEIKKIKLKDGFNDIEKDISFFKTNEKFINIKIHEAELKKKKEISFLDKREILRSVDLTSIYNETKKCLIESLTDKKFLIDRLCYGTLLIYLKDKNSYLLLEESYLNNAVKTSSYNLNLHQNLEFLNFNLFKNEADSTICFDNVFCVKEMFYLNGDIHLDILKTNFERTGRKERGLEVHSAIDLFRRDEAQENKFKGTLKKFCLENKLEIIDSMEIQECYSKKTVVEENKFYVRLKNNKLNSCFFSIEREKELKRLLLELDIFYEEFKKEIE